MKLTGSTMLTKSCHANARRSTV